MRRHFFSDPVLLQITVELTGKEFFSAIQPQALDLSFGFRFHKPFEVPETIEDFTLLLDEVDSREPRIIVDEGDKISASAKTNILCRSPYMKCIKSSLFRLRLRSFGKGNRCCFPSWQASQIVPSGH